jgi:hypothetical protein
MPGQSIASLLELRRHVKPELRPAWHVQIYQKELNGGKASERDLVRLEETPEATALSISGLDQRVFEALVRRFSGQLNALHLWKCPRIESFAPLEDMSGLAYLAIYWNTKVVRLWDLRKTPLLRGLHFDDVSKVHSLAELEAAQSLHELSFGSAISLKCEIDTLEPLSALQDLQSLSFNLKKIRDTRIQPLAKLKNLHELAFPTRQFTTEQVAWLRAHMPSTLQSEALEPFRRISPLAGAKRQIDILVSGKGKPFLSSQTDGAKLERYVKEFNKMVEQFTGDPLREPMSNQA